MREIKWGSVLHPVEWTSEHPDMWQRYLPGPFTTPPKPTIRQRLSRVLSRRSTP